MNRKFRISIALVLIMIFMTTSAFANSVGNNGEIKDVDVGYWDCWRYSNGVTWQNKKPGDWITYTYTIENTNENIVGVNDVQFYRGDKSTYNESSRSEWQSYRAYKQTLYPYAVQDLTITNYKYYSQGRVQLTVKARLVDNSNVGGFKITKKWQNAKVTGRRFYLPVYVNWKTKDDSFYVSGESVGSVGNISTHIIGERVIGPFNTDVHVNVFFQPVVDNEQAKYLSSDMEFDLKQGRTKKIDIDASSYSIYATPK